MTTIAGWVSRVEIFLNTDRLRAWNLVLAVATLLCGLGYLALSSGGMDPKGDPIGTDFISFYAASKLAIAGHPEAAYMPEMHQAAENAIFGRQVEYSAFFYPPIYLLYCLPLAFLPYFLSLALWQGTTFAAYWHVTRRFAGPHLDWLAIAAFPAVLVNLGHGQNAFLSAALFGAATLALNTRPTFAGVLLGCLAYKPQLGLVIPFALLAARRWKTFAAASVTVLALAAIATLAFGADTWSAFLANTPLAAAVLERGLVDAYKLQSTYAAVRVLGGSNAMASAAQGLITVGVIAVVIWVTARAPRRHVEPPLMALAALLASPFLLDYDLVLLALPLAWLFAEARQTGFLPYEKVTMFVAYILPLFSRMIAKEAGLPLAPLVIAALFVVVVRRVATDVQPVVSSPPLRAPRGRQYE